MKGDVVMLGETVNVVTVPGERRCFVGKLAWFGGMLDESLVGPLDGS